MGSRAIDLTGQRFGRLVVVSRCGKYKNGNATWNCHCDCGNSVVVDGYRLRKGLTKSCGCLRNELTKKRILKERVFGEHIGNTDNFVSPEGINYSSCRISTKNKTGVIGVSYDKKSGKYFARLYFKGRYVLIKSFTNFEDAVQCRRDAEEQYLHTHRK